jgi:Na+-transporting NADH:ubiquinone oxidoreductase subunit A
MSKVIKIKKGLDIPLLGGAEKILQSAPRSAVYAVKPPDFHGLTPKMLVKEGDRVKAGTPLFYDKYNEDIVFTSPVSGTFSLLVRGEKRRIMEVNIQADPETEYIQFKSGDPAGMSRQEVTSLLLKSGLWPVIRQRPYDIVARPGDMPKGIFISCFRSAPLGADLDFVVNGQESLFRKGLDALSRLTDGDVHLGVSASGTTSEAFLKPGKARVHAFSGPHPAGNVGVQIHHIDPINKGEVAWVVDVQAVIMIGRLFDQGIYDASRIVALAGSEVLNPRYYRVISGAQIGSFTRDNLRKQAGTTPRFISGDVLTGTRIPADGFLGFYHDMVSVIPEGDQPELAGWIAPNLDKFSISRTFPSALMPWRKFRLNTNIRSGERPFVITGLYERVLPMDILPMQLIKSIMINDIDMMEKLGIYEVAPEDFALCEYVCPSKIEIQSLVRDGLDTIHREFA